MFVIRAVTQVIDGMQLTEAHHRPKIETALDTYTPDPVPVHLVYPERKYMSSAVSATLDFLQEKLG